jgi:hypothetical protein
LKPNIIPPPPPPSIDSIPVVEDILPSDPVSELPIINDISPPAPPPPPGSDRKTRGFRVHIEPRTHTVTRTNKKQKLTVKQEPIEIKEIIAEPSSSIEIPIKGLFELKLCVDRIFVCYFRIKTFSDRKNEAFIIAISNNEYSIKSFISNE